MPQPRGFIIPTCDLGVLILESSKKKKGFQLPGGRCDPGEQPSDAALRELVEETGMRLKHADLRPFTVIDNRHYFVMDLAPHHFPADSPPHPSTASLPPPWMSLGLRLSHEHCGFRFASPVDAATLVLNHSSGASTAALQLYASSEAATSPAVSASAVPTGVPVPLSETTISTPALLHATPPPIYRRPGP
eukprot:TRINITY_DN62650_c0_g1_i1.p1 TRINITY_DN62650_c0_g1~~TRINITY_DN62650_c0_g1_i1.p1  ORF type:complete len:190 (+),score=9.66 TRINITY_DN62650_c0_g1_i1:115-684(+)